METSTSASSATTNVQGRETSEWQFLQCFGERAPGEDVQEGLAGPILATSANSSALSFQCHFIASANRQLHVALLQCRSMLQPRSNTIIEQKSGNQVTALALRTLNSMLYHSLLSRHQQILRVLARTASATSCSVPPPRSCASSS